MFTATQATTTRPTISLESTGEDVKDLQKVLNATVADTSLVVDGIFGNLTKEAVIAFQKYYGLTADGIVGSQAWAVVDTIIRVTLTLGSTREDVEYLQKTVKNGIGFGSLVVDGIFGVATQEAVKKFQKYYGLTVDGIVGSQTWATLESISTTPDEFAFTSLVDIGAGTEINFTDNGWRADGSFRPTEGTDVSNRKK